MYGNYNGLYGVNPYQNQLQQNRFVQTEQYGGGMDIHQVIIKCRL